MVIQKERDNISLMIRKGEYLHQKKKKRKGEYILAN